MNIHIPHKMILVLIALISVTNGQHYPNSAKPKGPFSKLTETTFRYEEKFGELVGKPETIKTYIYSTTGNIIDYRLFSSGKMQERLSYEYDSKDRVIKETTFSSNGLVNTNNIVWDSSNNKTKETRSDRKGNINELFKYEYDSFGNKITRSKYNKRGYNTETIKYEYDDQNRIVNETRYDSGGRSGYFSYKYDSFGNLIEEIDYVNHSGGIRNVHSYVYNTEKQIVRHGVMTYQDGQLIERTSKTFNYLESDTVFEKNLFDSDGVYGKTKLLKDYHGRVINKRTYRLRSQSQDGTYNLYLSSEFQYEYDSYDNLTKDVHFFGELIAGEWERVKSRMIVYKYSK